MQLTAIDAVGRGLANLRANRELILVQCVAVVALTLLSVAAALPLALALGFNFAALADMEPQQALARLADPGLWLSGGVLAAALGATVLGTAALLAYSWFQAGIFGVLVAGDRQAGAGERRPWQLYRTFSWSDFTQWGRMFVWRFFGWYHLYILVSFGLVALFGLLVIGALSAAMGSGPMAGVAIGCGGAIPLVLLAILMAIVSQAAKSDLARPESSAGASWRRALAVVGRRIGAALLVLLLLLCASMALSILVLPLQLISEVGLRDQLGLYLLAQFGVFVLQTVLGTLAGLAYGATWVALVRAELPDAPGAQ